ACHFAREAAAFGGHPAAGSTAATDGPAAVVEHDAQHDAAPDADDRHPGDGGGGPEPETVPDRPVLESRER
ncbi:hypothetical protein, partial [Isoptericola sp. QY 916]|uniref:hypothetical protein n=1 Tax=Isoptericola sp. QY 916 TaxID=2782570 RepID=UPI003D3005B3|nr:hypothetical protein [Isoptericola sp. QY 916]